MSENLRNLEQLLSKFQEVRVSLKTFEVSSEGDFLNVGSRLQAYHQKADGMTKNASTAAGMVAGETIVAAINELQTLLERGNTYLDHSDIEFAQTDNMLRYIMKILERISTVLHNFEKIVKNLKILSINIKILSAQLTTGRDEFMTLAEDVKKLAQNIDGRSKTINSNCRTLMSDIKSALARVDVHQKRHQQLTSTVLGNTEVTLAALRNKHEVSANMAKSITAMSGEIYHNIGNILVSLQFHDITRQQLEHVLEAVEGISVKLRESIQGSLGGAEYFNLIGMSNEISRLQAAQLIHTREELITAVEGMLHNLEGILRSVSEMSKQTVWMAGTATDTSTSFLKEMGGSIGAIATSLRESIVECAEIGRELSSTVREVVGTVDNMNAFMNDIEQIGTEMELLSLNARIKSAHTGTEGIGLSVIAESIQGLAESVCEKTGEVSKTLKSMIGAVQDDLGFGVDSVVKERTLEAETMIKELNDLGTSFDEVNEKIVAMLNDLHIKEGELAADIENTIESVTVHRHAARVLERVILTLNGIAQPLDMETIKQIEHDENVFKEIERKYTMQSERKIHQKHMESLKEAEEEKPAVHHEEDSNVSLFI